MAGMRPKTFFQRHCHGPGRPLGATNMYAREIMSVANSQALIHETASGLIAIEDLATPHGQFRMEYQSSQDGTLASAFLRTASTVVLKPFADALGDDGLICFTHPPYGNTPSHTELNLPLAIFRARFWALAHSHWHESGHLLDLAV